MHFFNITTAIFVMQKTISHQLPPDLYRDFGAGTHHCGISIPQTSYVKSKNPLN